MRERIEKKVGSARDRTSNCCSNRPYNRQECDTLLLKSIQMNTQTKLLYPFLTYCFLGLGMKIPLQSLLLSQGFVENFNEWKAQDVSENVLMDVYDCKMWKEFITKYLFHNHIHSVL